MAESIESMSFCSRSHFARQELVNVPVGSFQAVVPNISHGVFEAQLLLQIPPSDPEWCPSVRMRPSSAHQDLRWEGATSPVGLTPPHLRTV